MKKLLFFIPVVLLMAAQMDTKGLKVGDDALEFSLPNVDGTTVSLDDFKDKKGVIVVFTCNHCPYAKLYEDRIIDLGTKYKDEFPVVAISANDAEAYPEDSFKNMKKRAEKKAYPFAYLYDESQEIAVGYGASRTPEVFLLANEDGKFKVAYTGAIDNNPRNGAEADIYYLEDAINAVKAGNTPDPAETKAVGCSMKWKKS